jgi:hypothetical protein
MSLTIDEQAAIGQWVSTHRPDRIRPKYSTRIVIPVRTDQERPRTPMNYAQYDEHVKAIAGFTSESLVQRRDRERREAMWRLKVWALLIIPGCIAGWSIVVWSALQVIEKVR